MTNTAVHSDKNSSYFGTGVKVVTVAGVVYLLWKLFHADFKKWRPFGRAGDKWFGPGGNSSDQSKASDQDKDVQDVIDHTSSDAPGASKSDKDNYSYQVTFDRATGKPFDVRKTVGGIGFTRSEFIAYYWDKAQKAYTISGVFPETMFTQAIIESSNSKGQFGANDPLATQYNNYFGILADSGWNGQVWLDQNNGNTYRVYDSVDSSIADYYTFLTVNGRYDTAGVFEAKTPQDQLAAIARAGYGGPSDSYNALLQSVCADVLKIERVLKPGEVLVNVAKAAIDKAANAYEKGENSPVQREMLPGLTKAVMFAKENPKAVKIGVGVSLVVLAGLLLWPQKKKYNFNHQNQ